MKIIFPLPKIFFCSARMFRSKAKRIAEVNLIFSLMAEKNRGWIFTGQKLDIWNLTMKIRVTMKMKPRNQDTSKKISLTLKNDN